MKCPQCKFEQPESDACTHCGIIFSKYNEAQARSKEEDKPRRRPSPKNDNGSNDLIFYPMGVLFLLVVFARCIYFMEFPQFLDPYFRGLMVLAMIWLGFGIVPRAATLLSRFEESSDKKYGLDGFNIYDKKAIFLLTGLGSLMLLYLAWSILSGSIECFAGRNRTCHEIYDSLADTGEFWITALVVYGTSLLPVTVGYMGILIRRKM